MAEQIGEIIDLTVYRERRAEERLAVGATDVIASPAYGQTLLSPFAIPIAFFVFWPTWILMPDAPALNKDGSGAA